MDDWVEEMLKILCHFYRKFGGDCAELGIPDQNVIGIVDAILARLAAETPPQPTQAQIDQFLTDLHAHLALPGNNLTPAETAKVNQLIAALS